MFLNFLVTNIAVYYYTSFINKSDEFILEFTSHPSCGWTRPKDVC